MIERIDVFRRCHWFFLNLTFTGREGCVEGVDVVSPCRSSVSLSIVNDSWMIRGVYRDTHMW